ncbi:hypothetical protein [Mycoplasma seminis]|uniref:Uncharacterized protein n=1 Tax=Mycoplasma seminis TaxID=512749 RepID=A0ABY9HBC7_9MOLU|nr:hypothetical protein [Mycoplasma seminis]WLP85907.1 hypothetical protein Q8852_02055 [Mycoplasma seminis]
MKTADIERVKLLAESYLAAKAEMKENLKLIKDELDGTEITISESLDQGGRITYSEVTPRASFDFKGYSNYLYTAMIQGKNYTEEELDEIMKQFVVKKDSKWVLKITK